MIRAGEQTGRQRGKCRRHGVSVVGQVRRDRAGLLRTTALQAAVLSLLSTLAGQARAQPAPNARPTGGQVVAGAASISQGANLTAIDQSSARAAINWKSFDIGSQQTVQFNQPSASAVTLNRVITSDPSQIAGRIQANGQVIITNPNGVTFGRGAQVDTAGLVVSAAGITNQNFMAGRMVFDQPGSPNARIENSGTISIKDAGLAALVAPQVANNGVINAKMGRVILGGAVAHTVDLYGDGLLSIDVSGEVTQAPIGPDGKPVTALVTNSGIIRADGGTVQLTARAIDGIVRNLVTAGGTIQADSIGSHAGTVSVVGIGGDATASGTITARGRESGTAGGAVEVNATGTASVTSTGRIDVSGNAGGGTVALGTTLARARGGPAVTATLTAATAALDAGGVITADATGSGAGGAVTLLSHETTSLSGAITAQGGQTSGAGGSVELSGDGSVIATGSVSLGARDGASAGGTLLLDPVDLTITETGSGGNTFGVTGTTNNLGSLVNGAGAIVLSATDTLLITGVTTQLTNSLLGLVSLTAANEIDVESNFSVAGLAGGANIVLSAGNKVYVGAGDTLSSTGNISLAATGAAGVLQIDGALAGTGTGTISLSAGTGGILLATAAGNGTGLISTGALDFNTTGGLVQSNAASHNSTIAVASVAGTAGSASLNSTTNAIAALGSITTGGDFSLINAGPLSVAGPLHAANASITATGAGSGIVIPGTITATGNIVLTATSNITEAGTRETGALIATAGTLSVSTGDTATAASATLTGLNSIASIGSLSSTGNFTLNDQINGTFTGNTGITGALNLSGLRGFTQTTGTITAGTLTGSVGNSDFGASLLLNRGNSIANLGSFTVTGENTDGGFIGGTYSVGDNRTATIAGTVSAADISLRVQGFAMGASGALSLTGTGILEIAPFSAEPMVLGTGGGPGTLAIANTNGLPIATGNTGTNASIIRFGGYADTISAPGTVTATASTLTVAGNFTEQTGALELYTTKTGPADGNLAINALLDATGQPVTLSIPGTATESTAGSISADTLSGTVGAAILDNGSGIGAGTGNAVNTLGPITATDLFRFDDSGAISLGGNISGSAVSLRGTSLSFGSFTVTGTNLVELAPLTATPLTLGGGAGFDIASALAISTPLLRLGAVTAAGTTALNTGTATASSIDIALGNTYSPAATVGGVELDSAGTIGVAGALASTTATLARLVAGGTGNAILSSGSISLGAAASRIELHTGAGNITQSAGQFAAATLSLSTGTGNVDQTGGFANVDTLTGAVGGTISLPSGNFIGTISNLSGGSLVSIVDDTELTVIGSLATSNGGSLSLTDQPDGTPLIAFGTTGTDANVTAGTISLIASTPGTITETATSRITATALNDGGAQTGTANFAGTANAIATLGDFAASSSFFLADNQSLTVNGSVSAGTTLGLTTADGGALTLGQTGTAGFLSAPTVSLTVAGAVTEPNGGVSATILTGSANALALTSSTGNTISTLTGFAATNDLALTDTSALLLTGAVSAGTSSTMSLSDSAGIALGSLTIDPFALLPAQVSAGTIALAASGATISEFFSSTISATTLTGGGATASSVGLGGTNTIANLGAFASSGGFALSDTTGLTVTGAVASGTASTLSLATTGSLAIGGASTGSLSGGFVSLTATGAITEPNGAIKATTLAATGGTITLDAATNQVSTLVSSTGTNGFLLLDAVPLTVAGPIAAPSAGNVGLVADSITLLGLSASLTANTTSGAIELAPLSTTGTFTLSSIAADIAALSANTLRLGAYTKGGTRTVTAGTLINDASFTLPSSFKTLEANSRGAIDINAGLALGGTGSILLDAGGSIVLGANLTASGGFVGLAAGNSISQTAGIITATSLSATGTTGSVALTDSNAVATLTSGSGATGFALTDGQALNLPGPVDGGTGLASLVSTGGALIQGAASSITGGAVTLSGTSLILPGTITTAGLASLAETAAAGTISQIGTLIAGTLAIAAGLAGLTAPNALITGASATANTITTLAASTSNGLVLRNGGNLTVTGLVQTGAGGATISNTGSLGFASGGTITAANAAVTATSVAINAGGALLGNTVSLTATTGGIAVAGALTGTTSLALSATGTAGSITGAGVVTTDLLTGTATGGASLSGTANAITDLGSFTAATVAIADASTLDVTGTVSGTSVGLAAPTITVDSSVIGGTVSLDGTGGGITLNGLVSASTIATLTAPAGTISGAGTLLAASLVGTAAGNVALTGANAVGAIGSFTAGTFALDTGTLASPFVVGSLAITGPLTANTIAITATDPLAITATGSVNGSLTSLTATDITIAGSATGSTSLGLTATAGSIVETGSLATALLDVSATGSANLAGAGADANLVAALGTISANGFTLAAGTSSTIAGLSINGLLNGTSSVAITDTGSLTVAAAATVTASAITLGASTIELDGVVRTPGALALNASGNITEPAGGSAAITASSLSGSGAVVSLLGATALANQITAITPTFTATSFTLRDGLALSLSGVSASTLGITATTLDVTGAVSGNDVALASSTGTLGIDAGGSVTGTSGVTLSSATSMHDEGAVITPGTLSGSAIGSASLLGGSATANQIATLGNFTADGFTLRSATGTGVAGLAVAGTVDGNGLASISETGPLSIATGGLVTATSVSLTSLGAGMTIAGTANGTAVTLASDGTIGESGTISAVTLSGTATGAALLTGSNNIDTLSSFGANGFTLIDGANPLTIAGTLAGGTLASVIGADTIDVASGGQVSASSIGLTATAISVEGGVLGTSTVLDATTGSITIPGSVAGTTGLALLAANGAISASGTLASGALTGTAAGTASLTGAANSITTLGSFSAGGLTLVDGAPLAITGPVASTSFASVSDTAGITLSTGATLAAQDVTLSGGGLALDGLLLGSLTTTLVSTTTIAAPGTIDTAFLTGSASGNAAMTGPNAIATLGSFSAAAFALTAGTLAAPIAVAGLAVSGPVTATGAASIKETGPLTIGAGGSVAGDTVTLTATGDSLTIAGAVTGTTAIALAADAAITETGTLTGATLSATSSGSASLLGASPSANAIGTLATSSANGLQFADGTDLAIAGAVTGGTLASIASTGSLALAAGGSVSADAVTLSAGAAGMSLAGVVTGTTSTNLASLGTISETGGAQGGTLLTGSLTGTAIGDATLTQGANVIGTLGAFTAPNILLDATTGSLATTGISVTGPVTATGNASIIETGTLAVPGSISAADLALSSTGADLVLGGTLTGTTTMALSAHGAITAPGTLSTALLSGSAGTTASINGTANAIDTLGGFAAPGGLKLTDASPLGVTGPATGSLVALTAPSITVPGSITGSTVTLAATTAGIAIPGSLTGSSNVSLTAPGAIDETGTLTTALLSGSATGSASFLGASASANAIGTLGAFTATSLALADGSALAIAGPVGASNDASLASTSAITLTGALSAATVTLAAAGSGISLPGTLTAGTSLALSASAGTIGETGTIATPLLTGTARGAITLAGASASANRIGTLGALTAASLALNDGLALTIQGPATLTGNAAIVDIAPITLNGQLGAASVALTGNAITIPGTLAGSGLVSLTATGTIGETGVLQAGTLAVSAGGNAALLGTNQIGTLGNVAATGFELFNAGDGTISGTISTGPSLVLDYGGAITLLPGGSLAATAIDLAASTLTLNGVLTGAADTLLSRTGGIAIGGSVSGTDSVAVTAATALDETGTLVAGLLSGSAGGTASLAGRAAGVNSIGTLGAFTASSLALDDGRALLIDGPVAAGSQAALTDSAGITLAGSLTADTATLTAPGIVIAAGSSVGTGSLLVGAGTLHASAGDIAIGGDISATRTLSLTASGAIDEPGTITTPGLFAFAGSTANLAGNASNHIGSLDAFTTDLIANDLDSLTVGTAIAGNTMSLSTAGDLAILSSLSGKTVTLVAGGALTSQGGFLAGTLSGSAVGAASILGTSTSIATLGDFTANGITLVDRSGLVIAGSVSSTGAAGPAAFALSESGSLDIPGTLAGGALSITAGGTIGETGVLLANGLSGSATGAVSLAGAGPAVNTVTTLGDFQAPDFALRSAGSLTIAGTLSQISPSGGAPGTTSLQTTGDIAIPGQINTGTLVLLSGGAIQELGEIDASLVTGSAASSAALIDFGPFRNTIAMLGPFTAGTSFALNDQSGLGVVGALDAATSIAITTNGTLGGGALISAPSVTLNANGSISQAATSPAGVALAGALSTGTLNVTSTAGAISLPTASNAISTIGSATSAGAMTIADSTPLTAGPITTAAAPVAISDSGGSVSLLGGLNASTLTVTAMSGSATYAGPLVANTIVSNTGGPVTLSGNLVTGGELRPAGSITATGLPSATNILQGGAYFITNGGDFIQAGDTTVSPLGGNGSILSIVTKGGAVSFGTLNARQTWLVVDAGAGKITGNINVQGLDVGFPVAGPGGASLIGTVNDLGGLGAAGAGFIQPQRSNVYRINNCPIQSVNCVLLRPEAVPVVNPVSDLDAGVLPPAANDPDLILPDIGGQGIEVGAGPDQSESDRRDKERREKELREKDQDVQTPGIGRRDIPQP